MEDLSYFSSEPNTPCESSTKMKHGRTSDLDDDDQMKKEQPKDVPKPTERRQAVFIDPAAMRAKIRAEATKPAYDVSVYYYETGAWQAIAKSGVFEKMTLTVIAFNALWIAIDTDGNDAPMLLQAKPVYQIAEHLFCMYFCFEWYCRFKSFRVKSDGRKDGWFVFDSCLVAMMFLETWVMTAVLLTIGGGGGLGNVSILRMARLLRLSRMARMARLFRAMPELLILIKGMAAACRSVFFTLCLLGIIIYVFGIAFRQLTAGTAVGALYFNSVPLAMHTLLLDGTIMDGLGDLVKALGEESILFAGLFYLFVLLAAFTVLNMLIGVLCEVVSAVASTEREKMAVDFVKQQLTKVMYEINQDGDTTISKEEFANIVNSEEACNALQEVGVDVPGLIENIDIIFAKDNEDDEEKSLSFEDFMDTILRLRGDNYATVKDIVDLRKYITTLNSRLREEMRTTGDLKSRLSRVMNEGAQMAPTLSIQPVSPQRNPKAPTAPWVNDVYHVQQTLLSVPETAGHMAHGPSNEEAPPPHWPVDSLVKGEDLQLWMRRARLVETLAMAQMELSRFIECLPPSELCAPGIDMLDTMDTDGSPAGYSSLTAVLPGQLDELTRHDFAAANGVGGRPDALSALCARWNQPELEDMKRQFGSLQEELLGGIVSLQRVRERCYPYRPVWRSI